MGTPKTIKVDLGDRSYDIIIGAGLLKQADTYLIDRLNGGRVAIITDENVAGLHLQTLTDALDGHGLSVETIILPPGEGQKSFDVLQDVLGRLLKANFSRSDTLIAFGGGVIGDLTGFAASVLKRGCGFIQIPTTLLAQVDSSVGGKTAINMLAGKNLVGAFYQPSLVLTDTNVLATLPLRQLKAGYAEVLKYGLINDRPFFDWLDQNGAKILAGDADAQSEAIARSCASKAAIVAEDEREQGVRALLNLGHTFGHALEAKGGYSDMLLHGEAISAGMLMAFEYGQEIGVCAGQDVERLRAHLLGLEMPILETLDPAIKSDPGQLFDYMMQDKKNKDTDMTLILAREIGGSYIEPNADQSSVKDYLKRACARPKD
jgi:3-dehydroquinate synthase